MKINWLEKKTWSQVEDELLRGGKFVRFQYCVSILIFTLYPANRGVLFPRVKAPAWLACHLR